MVGTVETTGQETKAKGKSKRKPNSAECYLRHDQVEAGDASIDEVGALSTGISSTKGCCSKRPRRGKEQRVRTWPRKETVRTGTREEGARVQGTVPNSFTSTAETHEPGNGTQEPKNKARKKTQRPLKEKSSANCRRSRVKVTQSSIQSPVRHSRAKVPTESPKTDVAEDTMSAMVKLAKDPLEPYDIGQPTAECHLMAWRRSRESW